MFNTPALSELTRLPRTELDNILTKSGSNGHRDGGNNGVDMWVAVGAEGTVLGADVIAYDNKRGRVRPEIEHILSAPLLEVAAQIAEATTKLKQAGYEEKTGEYRASVFSFDNWVVGIHLFGTKSLEWVLVDITTEHRRFLYGKSRTAFNECHEAIIEALRVHR
jgi:hypothetical protein